MAKPFLFRLTRANLANAATAYTALSEAQVTGILKAQHLDVQANAANTTIHSIVLVAQPNGRMMLLGNTGAAGNIVLPNNSGSGTSGWRFATPGSSYTIPPGGGAVILYDETITPGFWRVMGIP